MKAKGSLCSALAVVCGLLMAATPSWSSPAYFVDIRTNPQVLRAGELAQLEIRVHDGSSGAEVRQLQTTHEEQFHLYFVDRKSTRLNSSH